MALCEMCGNEIDEAAQDCPFCATSREVNKGNLTRQAKYKTVNLEKGLPSIEEAQQKLQWEVSRARSSGIKVLKIIHGYGSSGVGGTLRVELRKYLATMVRNNTIDSYYTGEEFLSQFEDTKIMLKRFPKLHKDSDLNRKNQGITIVVL